jgi:CRISPR/Cas system-associated protein Csx1
MARKALTAMVLAAQLKIDTNVLISRKIFTSFEIIRVPTSAIENHIEKLQEYRRSLITAAVTDKLAISEVEPDV